MCRALGTSRQFDSVATSAARQSAAGFTSVGFADTFTADSRGFRGCWPLIPSSTRDLAERQADPRRPREQALLNSASAFFRKGVDYTLGESVPHSIIVSEPSSRREAWLRIGHFADWEGEFPVSSSQFLPSGGRYPTCCTGHCCRAAVCEALGVSRRLQVYNRRLSPTFCHRERARVTTG